MQGRRVRPRRARPEPAIPRGALTALLQQGLEVALEWAPRHIIPELTAWAQATLGRAVLRAALWGAMLVGAPRLSPLQRTAWRRALREAMTRLDETEPGG